jgi:hypothetical protein
MDRRDRKRLCSKYQSKVHFAMLPSQEQNNSACLYAEAEKELGSNFLAEILAIRSRVWWNFG